MSVLGAVKVMPDHEGKKSKPRWTGFLSSPFPERKQTIYCRPKCLFYRPGVNNILATSVINVGGAGEEGD